MTSTTSQSIFEKPSNKQSAFQDAQSFLLIELAIVYACSVLCGFIIQIFHAQSELTRNNEPSAVVFF